MSRLTPQPGELVQRDRPVTFTFDGKPVSGLAGDTIASALYASGQRTFSRSFKYHRRRGLLCGAGHCPNCLVCVDGAPGARACTEPVREGSRVEHLNATPNLQFDVMSLIDRVGGPFTPPGFYYKTFMRPRRFWPLYERVLRHAAGLGRLPKEPTERTWQTEYRRRHADVVVVGAGLAGLSAATAAAELGADVVLVDDGPEPGGRLLWEGRRALAAQLTAQAIDAGVELLWAAAAVGHYDGLVAVWQGNTLHQIRARRQVYATGAIEQPLVFDGNDLPGVMLTGAAQRLVAAYAVAPGRRAVVVTVCDRGHDTAQALHAAGIEIAAVADLRTEPTAAAELTSRAGIEILHGYTAVAARGRKHVTGVAVAPVSAPAGTSRTLDCDLLVVCGGEIPAAALVSQAGARSSYVQAAGTFVPADLAESVLIAGDVAGEGATDLAAVSGELAGVLAFEAVAGGGDVRGLADRCATLRARLAEAAPAQVAVPPAQPAGGPHRRAFACVCEDVTAKDIRSAIDEGYDSIELCKRYTTVTMGPCQGRMCQLAAARLVAEATGADVAAVGTTTARPPASTVPLGLLAGRPWEPVKRSAIQARHRELGATIRWAGDWHRPYDYGDAEGEVQAVHEAAGLIDVSTLGKLLVTGGDAGAFLDRLYPNRLSDLAPGRVRYGLLASDAGRIMDDGTVCRLTEDAFYVTTTSAGAGAAEQWFSWWLADWGMDVVLTDVTQALAAVNLAGPDARKVLETHTDADCSPQAFKYLDAVQARVAGVPALLIRIGFVGELSYEIHCPSALGRHLWDAVLAGSPVPVRPFGLEAQRVLRLEKQHLIVGQDTDSESTPYGAGMAWAVKLDKEAPFIGKSALSRFAGSEQQSVLVGFTLANGHVPTEGAVVLDAAGTVAGQVTSARRSRQLGEVIGMAWVPASLATDGAELSISDGGTELTASVMTAPFYDPAGELVRS